MTVAFVLYGTALVFLIVGICGVNLVLQKLREYPVTEYDRGVTWWTVAFVVLELAGWAWVGR
jgi:predicted tellurium resistance membrane protein TerC